MLLDGGYLSQQHLCGILHSAMLVYARGFPKSAECEQHQCLFWDPGICFTWARQPALHRQCENVSSLLENVPGSLGFLLILSLRSTWILISCSALNSADLWRWAAGASEEYKEYQQLSGQNVQLGKWQVLHVGCKTLQMLRLMMVTENYMCLNEKLLHWCSSNEIY